ncbi:MAG: TIGR02450 family Trp-rich protein [Pseudomonadota bacterium]
MNRINPNKLLHSKWTAVQPVGKARHFMVVELERDVDGVVMRCLLDAVVVGQASWLDWHALKNADAWRHGWR